jgi:hypothetical protein
MAQPQKEPLRALSEQEERELKRAAGCGAQGQSLGVLDTLSVSACLWCNASCARLRGEFFVWSGDVVMGSSPFLPLPSTLSIDTVEPQSQTLIVHLHATAVTAPCPRCGTPGSRVHSRYRRTVADVACGGQHVTLKLLVRKWICALVSCPQRIKASRFLELVQTSARMTQRLIQALQSAALSLTLFRSEAKTASQRQFAGTVSSR